MFSTPVPQVVVPGGLVSILAYIGHPGGLQEYEAVKGLIAELSPSYWWVVGVGWWSVRGGRRSSWQVTDCG